jgi:transposase
MQDGALDLSAYATQQEYLERELSSCLACPPPVSPDLNLIEDVWNWMKDYLENNFPEMAS